MISIEKVVFICQIIFMKIRTGFAYYERDSAFVLNGQAYLYSSECFNMSCKIEKPEFINDNQYEKLKEKLIKPRALVIPDVISSKALEYFIEALEKPAISIEKSYIGDLYGLCLLFNFRRLMKEMQNQNLIPDTEKMISFNQIFLTFLIEEDTSSSEADLAKIFSEFTNSPLLCVIPPQILVRIAEKAELSTSNVIDLIKMLKSNRKEMSCYFYLFSMIKYYELEQTDIEFVLQECENQAIKQVMSRFLLSHLNQQELEIEQSRNELKGLDSTIKNQKDEINGLREARMEQLIL